MGAWCTPILITLAFITGILLRQAQGQDTAEAIDPLIIRCVTCANCTEVRSKSAPAEVDPMHDVWNCDLGVEKDEGDGCIIYNDGKHIFRGCRTVEDSTGKKVPCSDMTPPLGVEHYCLCFKSRCNDFDVIKGSNNGSASSSTPIPFFSLSTKTEASLPALIVPGLIHIVQIFIPKYDK